MLKTTLSCLIVLGTSFALAAEQHDASTPTVEIPKIEMRLIETDEGAMAEVLSDQKLVNPRIEYVCGEWTSCHEPVAENGKFLYRGKSYYTPTPNTLFSVTSEAPGKALEFQASYAFRQGGKDRKEPVLLETVKPNALVAAGPTRRGPIGSCGPSTDGGLGSICRRWPMIPEWRPFPRPTTRWAGYMPTRAIVARPGLALRIPNPPWRCG